ncbi:MAG: hypothetical protein K0R41_1667 [Geminicoccaceae bacterium]|nr:hypothetical protein [Geminicoccaceae bacterium]
MSNPRGSSPGGAQRQTGAAVPHLPLLRLSGGRATVQRVGKAGLVERGARRGERALFMSTLGVLLLVLLILVLIGVFPAYSYSRDWGYYPTGAIGLALIIVLILILLGRI